MACFDVGCKCGSVQLQIDVPRRSAGTRVVCHCRDCQAAANFLGTQDRLAVGAGTDIWQTTPDKLRIVKGGEHLGILQLSPKGLYRWRATCCDTPMMNSLRKLTLPFVGIVLGTPDAARDKITGPVFAHAFTASAPPGTGGPSRDVNFARTGLGVVTRMIGAYLSGKAKENPILQWADAPVRVLTLEERKAAMSP